MIIFLSLVSVIVIGIFILRYLDKKDAASSSRSTTLNDVLQNAYPRLSYAEIFELGILNAFDLLRSFPCYIKNEIETYAFFYLIGELSVKTVGGNQREYQKSIDAYITSKLTAEQRTVFQNRVSFYQSISCGAKVEGLWSPGDIPPSVLSVPMLRCTVAFGDCITNPDMIEDYYGAPILLYGISQIVEFHQRFTDDFYRLVHTYCVMVAGREFDPPIIYEYDT